MLKKTLLIALAAASAAIVAAPAMAADTNCPAFNGFYAGVGALRDTADFKVKSATTTTHYGADGFGGKLFAGYGYVVDGGFYLGGEAFGSLNSLKDNVAGQTYKIKNTYGVDLLPGYMLSNSTLGFVKVGYAKSKFEASDAGTSLGHESLNGVQYGVGLQTALMNNVSLRADYTFTNYQAKALSRSGTRVNPTTDQFGLALAYSFS